MPRVTIDLADVRQLPLVHRASIPEEYLDEMGHVNVMWYTYLFSRGMRGVFERVSLTWEEIAAWHGGTFALETHARFLSEIRVDQSIEVHARVLGRSEKRFHVLQFMINTDKSDVSATLETVGAYVDTRNRKMAPFPDRVADAWDALIDQHQRLAWAPPVCGTMAP